MLNLDRLANIDEVLANAPSSKELLLRITKGLSPEERAGIAHILNVAFFNGIKAGLTKVREITA